MLLGFKTRLKPNNKQITAFKRHAGTARHAWNNALAYTKLVLDVNRLAKEAGREDLKRKFPSAIDLHKWLVANVKPDHPWYYESSKAAPQNALRDLRVAWDRAFKKKAKPPRFKKKGQKDSFRVEGSIRVESFRIKLPVIGWVKTFERLPEGFKPKNVTISRQADQWFVSFKSEVETTESNGLSRIVGVDLGLNHFATLSDGKVFDAPKPYRRYQKKLAKMQYLNRNKVKGSSNWRKAQVKIARLHQRIANIRKDFIHKLTTYLAKNHGTVVIEDLNVSGMLKNGKLSKAISDAGFYEFKRQLTYKSELYGCQLVKADRWFPSSKLCSYCGQKKADLTLSDRVFDCDNCKKVIDRDLNAAINLKGLSCSPLRSVDREVPTPLDEAGSKQLNLFV